MQEYNCIAMCKKIFVEAVSSLNVSYNKHNPYIYIYITAFYFGFHLKGGVNDESQGEGFETLVAINRYGQKPGVRVCQFTGGMLGRRVYPCPEVYTTGIVN